MKEGYILGGGGGPDLDVITASTDDILNGKVGVNNEGEPITGTMPNRGSADDNGVFGWVDQNNKRVYVRMHEGAYRPYSNGDLPATGATFASVAAGIALNANKLLAHQTVLDITGTATSDATASADKILNGYSAYVDGKKVNGSLTVQSAVSFSVAQYSSLTIIASWAKPSKGPWSGLRIICKQGSYPTNAWDGTLFYEGAGTWGTKQLTAGTWYFRAWNYIETNAGRMYGSYLQGATSNNEIKGMQTFTQSGVFTVPANVRTIQAFVVGGGGGMYQAESNCSGGGGGGYTNYGTFAVTPGQQLAVIVGAGGNFGGSYLGGTPSNGGTTSVGNLISANGGAYGREYGGGTGGSGGGNYGRGEKESAWPGDGGENGSNGYNTGNHMPSPPTGPAGQGRTTRAFGEASGTLYAGGGGGGNSEAYTTAGGGAGGGGNGAGRGYNPPTNGSPNTGGGAGGTFWNNKNSGSNKGSVGGSGIAIIRWGY